MPARPFLAIRRGTTRWVLLVGPFVFKVPRLRPVPGCGTGRAANLAEAALSGDPRFCPVLAADPWGLLLVMARADDVTAEEVQAAGGKSWIVDASPKNFGRLGGRVVAIDYALETRKFLAELDRARLAAARGGA